MINVTIFALPLSSTIVMFSGLAGVTLMAFNSYENLKSLVITSWLIGEALIWIFTPLIAMALTYGL
jgi:phosphate/sulfate permease